jgi:hypothetical protein
MPISNKFIPYARTTPFIDPAGIRISQNYAFFVCTETFLVFTSMYYDSIGLVYWAPESVVFKFTRSKKRHSYLLHEAAIYQRLMSTRAGHFVPTIIDYFRMTEHTLSYSVMSGTILKASNSFHWMNSQLIHIFSGLIS